MGNQQKKDAKRATRKKLQARDNQIRNEQESLMRKEMLHSFMNDTVFDLVRRFVNDGRASEETNLYKRLKDDEVFNEIQQRVLGQAQLQANDPRTSHRYRAIPPRLYICKDSSAVATLLVSPLVLIKTDTPLVKATQAFYDIYSEGGGARFVCYVFGVLSSPGAEHFAIVAGPDKEWELFCISAGRWARIGNGEVTEALLLSLSKLLLENSERAPKEDPFDDVIQRMVDDEALAGDDQIQLYETIAYDVAGAVEPIAGEMLSRVEDWVTQQHHTIVRLHSELDDVSVDLAAARKLAVEHDKQIKRTAAELATAKAHLASRPNQASGPAVVAARPLKERMAEIFLG